MEERLKRIKELSQLVKNKSMSDDEIIKVILKKYPELKNYKHKINKMSISYGSTIKYVSNDLQRISGGIVTSIKYYSHEDKEEEKIIESLGLLSKDHWWTINVKNYYLFEKIHNNILNDELIQDALKSKNINNFNDIHDNYDNFKNNNTDTEQYFVDQTNEYYKDD